MSVPLCFAPDEARYTRIDVRCWCLCSLRCDPVPRFLRKDGPSAKVLKRLRSDGHNNADTLFVENGSEGFELPSELHGAMDVDAEDGKDLVSDAMSVLDESEVTKWIGSSVVLLDKHRYSNLKWIFQNVYAPSCFVFFNRIKKRAKMRLELQSGRNVSLFTQAD